MEARRKDDLKRYFRWPFFFGIVLVAAIPFVVWLNGWESGLLMFIVALAYYLVALFFYLFFRLHIERKLVRYGEEFSKAQDGMLREIDIPFAFVNDEGAVLWSNPAFTELFGQEEKKWKNLPELFPETSEIRIAEEKELHVTHEGRQYALSVARAPEALSEGHASLSDRKNAGLNLIHLTDETDLLYYKKTLEEEKAVMALVYFDNYEEVMEGIEYVRRSLLSALLERKVNKYFGDLSAVVRKLEKDRFFIVMKQETLWALEKLKFSLLEEIKTVSIGNNMAVTVSIGVGLGGESFEKNYEYARSAIDMAFGRGGDQAVVKNGSEVRYFGGKAKSTERTTRVKARMKAHSLRELIESKERVVIMGHPLSDMDCIGAAVAIYRAAKFSGKRANIVIKEVSASIKPIITSYTENSDYEADMFINPEEAKVLTWRDTLLVVVDTNRPSYTVCPELLELAQSVVVIDHHRQGREFIENAELSYVEPFASSASEMAAELVQYYDDNIKLRPAEADTVFAGIVMDTNNFEDKAGVRTFEAAAYLRRCGADVTRVRKLFRDSMDDYKLRAETVRRAEVYKDGYIISVCPSEDGNPNQTVVAAQAANELLEIRGIKASFVLTEFEGRIFVSARSIGEVNVQVMMEKLGGGGHLSVAGAQFTGITIEEAMERLKAVIEEEA